MNVSLTPELETIVAEKVGSGRYSSASEVVREGLRLLLHRDQTHEAKLAALRGDIRKGIAELEAGQFRDGEEMMNEIGDRLRRLKVGNG